jgi:hypothetical protein
MEVKRCSHFGMTFSFGGSFERWRTFNSSGLLRCPRALTERSILSVSTVLIGLSLISCGMNFFTRRGGKTKGTNKEQSENYNNSNVKPIVFKLKEPI